MEFISIILLPIAILICIIAWITAQDSKEEKAFKEEMRRQVAESFGEEKRGDD